MLDNQKIIAYNNDAGKTANKPKVKHRKGDNIAEKSKGGRKPLPPNVKKNEHRVYLKDSLYEWLLSKGNGNLSTAIELMAQTAGFKEGEGKKEGEARKRLRVSNSEPLTCLEVAV